MAVGDMKYKFVDLNGEEQEIVVPAEVLRKGKRAGMTNRETIMKFAFENGYAVQEPQTKKKAKSTTKRTRKPNDKKKMLIDRLADSIGELGSVNIINPERQVQIDIDGTIFEFTLVQKRASK